MKTLLTKVVAMSVIVCSAGPASAWGPVTQSSVVTAGAHVLSREDSFPLKNLLQYVYEGASISDEEMAGQHPLFEIDPVGAIQREMILLQSIRGDRIDPYYAYRLGVLGNLVVRATAPLANAPATIRAQYYQDVDANINGVDLEIRARKLVDPRAYFTAVAVQSRREDETIIIEYRGGTGFNGLARASLSLDASRSVNAVADVWDTILSSGVAAFDSLPANMREYTLGGIAFYLRQGNLQEVDLSYQEAQERRLLDTDLQKSIGDLFFDAGEYDRAIEEYQKVITQTPDRRDVTQRISKYYVEAGDEAVARQLLEQAQKSYAAALEADSLHPDAQRKLIDVEDEIFARDERLVSYRLAIDQAEQLKNQATQAASRRNYAGAMAHLRDAEVHYLTVSDEFAVESQRAARGLKDTVMRLQEVKSAMIANAQNLSGSGFAFDARRLAQGVDSRSARAMQDMLDEEYEASMQELRRQVTASLDTIP